MMPQTPVRVTTASCDFADMQVGGWAAVLEGKRTEVNSCLTPGMPQNDEAE